MNLPPLNNKKTQKGSVKLPDIEILGEDEEGFKDDFVDNVKLDRKEQLQYRRLFGIFNEEIQDKTLLLKHYEKEFKEKGLYNLEELNRAIDEGKVDLRKYDAFTMSKLIEKMAEGHIKSLDSYNIETIEDFYMHVTSGKLDVSKYDEDELDEFIIKLTNKKD